MFVQTISFRPNASSDQRLIRLVVCHTTIAASFVISLVLFDKKIYKLPNTHLNILHKNYKTKTVSNTYIEYLVKQGITTIFISQQFNQLGKKTHYFVLPII